jgi:hypothetical protein
MLANQMTDGEDINTEARPGGAKLLVCNQHRFLFKLWFKSAIFL